MPLRSQTINYGIHEKNSFALRTTFQTITRKRVPDIQSTKMDKLALLGLRTCPFSLRDLPTFSGYPSQKDGSPLSFCSTSFAMKPYRDVVLQENFS